MPATENSLLPQHSNLATTNDSNATAISEASELRSKLKKESDDRIEALLEAHKKESEARMEALKAKFAEDRKRNLERLESLNKEFEKQKNECALLDCIGQNNLFDETGANALIGKTGLNFRYGPTKATPLLLAIEYKNTKALQFLFKRNADLEYCDGKGNPPLMYALTRERYDFAVLLVQNGANLFSLSVVDLIESDTTKEGKEFRNFAIQHFMKNLTPARIEKLTLSEIAGIPFHWLTQEKEILERISIRLKALLKAEDAVLSKEIIEPLCGALDANKATKLKKINLLTAVANLAYFIIQPEKIIRKDANLCGPIAFLQLLIKTNPKLVVDLGLGLAIRGRTESPFKLDLSDYSKQSAITILEVLVIELRRAENYTGYSPVSFRESLQGVTAPRTLCKWLQMTGYEEVVDKMMMAKPSCSALTKPRNTLLHMFFGGFHHKQHQTFSSENANLETLEKDLKSGKEAILLMSAEFSDMLHPKKLNWLETAVSAIMPIEHYILLSKLETAQNDIQLEFSTFGKIHSMKLPREAFLKAYRGAIVCSAPKAKAELSVRPSK